MPPSEEEIYSQQNLELQRSEFGHKGDGLLQAGYDAQGHEGQEVLHAWQLPLGICLMPKTFSMCKDVELSWLPPMERRT